MTSDSNDSAGMTLKRMNMLVWRMDLSARLFDNLNNYSGSILCRENCRFFKDAEYMKKLLLPEDLPTVTRAVAKIKERLPVQVVFRIHDGEALHWFKLSGWPTPSRKIYEGTVEEVSDHINQLQDLFAGRGKRLFTIESIAYPAAIFSGRNQLLVKCNDSFRDLLGMTLPHKIKYRLTEIISYEVKLPLLFERLLQMEKITEEFTLIGERGQSIRAHCNLEQFSYNTEDLIRIAVVDLVVAQNNDAEHKNGAKNSVVRSLCDSLKTSASIAEMLQAIYTEQHIFPAMGAAIFSDIYTKKNKVFAYAQGDLLVDLREGEQFPYSGTIAEHIEKENLEYLIVNDTHASIKAIDWMLFVPNGIRSYIAKALYVRGAMRTVIILCSEQKQAFSEHHISYLSEIAIAFQQRLRQLRKN